jgi:hypothetical protein
MPDPNVAPRFAVCVANDGCDDLSVGMLYGVIPDDAATVEGLLRVVDDSGEDYIYPAARFVSVVVPEDEVPRLLTAKVSEQAAGKWPTPPPRSPGSSRPTPT